MITLSVYILFQQRWVQAIQTSFLLMSVSRFCLWTNMTDITWHILAAMYSNRVVLWAARMYFLHINWLRSTRRNGEAKLTRLRNHLTSKGYSVLDIDQYRGVSIIQPSTVNIRACSMFKWGLTHEGLDDRSLALTFSHIHRQPLKGTALGLREAGDLFEARLRNQFHRCAEVCRPRQLSAKTRFDNGNCEPSASQFPQPYNLQLFRDYRGADVFQLNFLFFHSTLLLLGDPKADPYINVVVVLSKSSALAVIS